MSIKSLVGVLALCAASLFVVDSTVTGSMVEGIRTVLITTSGELGKSNYKIATSGSAASKKPRDMFRITVEGLTLESGDYVSLSVEGQTDTVDIGDPDNPATDGLEMTDPNGKGKILKGAKKATVDGFSAKGKYKFANTAKGKASKLQLRFMKGRAGGVVDDTTTQKNEQESVKVRINVEHDDGHVENFELEETWLINRKVKKDNTNFIKAKYKP